MGKWNPSKRGARRLAILEEELRKPLKCKFDLAQWGIHGGTHEPGEHHWCGTTACAVGVAILSPRLPGMRGTWLEHNELYGNSSWLLLPGGEGEAFSFSGPWDYIEQYFGIDSIIASWLFVPTAYPKNQRKLPIAVADRIAKVLSGYGITMKDLVQRFQEEEDDA